MLGTNEGVVPLRVEALESNQTAMAEQEERERSLLFVAATRARETLVVVSWQGLCRIAADC